MVSLVYYLVLFDIIARSASLPTINLMVYKDYKDSNKIKIKRSASDLLELNKPFMIKVENLDEYKVLKYIECHYVKNVGVKYVDKSMERKKNVYTVKVQKATHLMETEWICSITDVRSSKVQVTFEVKLVKTAKDIPSEVLVNDVKIGITPILEGTEEFNARGEYWFQKGELAKLTCVKLDGNVMNMEYHDVDTSNTSRSITTIAQDVREQTMQVKLTQKQDSSFINCNVMKLNTNSKYTVRLYFYSKPPDSDLDKPIFDVNSMRLTPMNDSGKLRYTYEYNGEDAITIKGSLKNPNDQWYCETDVPQLRPIISQHERIDLTVTLPHDITSAPVNCKAGVYAVFLALVPKNVGDYVPTIGGLSSAQVLLAYKPGPNDYIIKYNNILNKNLNLTCTSQRTGCKWLKDGQAVYGEKDEYFDNTNNNKISYMFEPLLKDTSSEIKCKCTDTRNTTAYTTSVEVINGHNGNEATGPPLVEENSAGSDGGAEDPEPAVAPNSPSIPPEMLAGIIGGALVVVILVIWIIVGIHKRKRRLEQAQQSDINYENLQEHHEGPMPTPAQWNNYSQPLQVEETYTYAVPYVEKNVEDMYAKPKPKGQRQPLETLYAEVGGQGEPNYATVGSEGEAGPKAEYANLSQQQMPLYSQIQPKKLLDNARSAPQVLPRLPNNENYAQVLPKSMRKDSEAYKYQNVFDNQRYANTQAKDDYAEPAYCELNPKNAK